MGRARRKVWLESEKQAALAVMREQMKASPGHWKWPAIRDAYNMRMAGTVQRAGEKLAKAGTLKEDRVAPTRSIPGIRGTAYESWPEYHAMVEKYKHVTGSGRENGEEDGENEG